MRSERVTRSRILCFAIASLLAVACQRPAEDSAFTAERDLAAQPEMGGGGPASAQQTRTLVIRDVTVIDSDGTRLSGSTIVIRDGRIVELHREDARIPDDAQVVDGTGRYLISGLWDAHTHLTYAGECGLPLMIAHGVTSVRDLGGTPELDAWLDRIAIGETIGPRVWTAGPNIELKAWMDGAREHLGPMLAGPEWAGFDLWAASPRLEVANDDDARAAVDSLVALGVDIAKFRNLDGETFRAFAAAARERGLPLAGHSPRDLSLGEAAEGGLASIEHADALATRLADLAPDEIRRELERVRDAGTMLTPTLVSGTPRSDAHVTAVMADSTGAVEPRQPYVSRGQHRMWQFMFATRGAGGPPDPNARRNEIALVRAAHDAGVPLLAGTDLGVLLTYPGSSLHEELEILVRDVGLTPAEALATATINPARFLGLQDRLGRIRPGYYADLVLLDADPIEDIGNVRLIDTVIWRGRVLSRADLEGLRALALAAVKAGGAQCSVVGGSTRAG